MFSRRLLSDTARPMTRPRGVMIAESRVHIVLEPASSATWRQLPSGPSRLRTFGSRPSSMAAVTLSGSPAISGALALSHLSDIFSYLGLNVLAQRVKIPHMKKNFQEGQVIDAFIAQLLHEQAALLAKA